MITHFPDNIPEFSKADNAYNSNIFVTARQALYQYLKSKEYKSVLLPSFCAFGAWQPYKLHGIKIDYYDFDENYNIQLREKLGNYKQHLFHYIHPFGLYIADNVTFLEANRINFAAVLDDRALSLPLKPYYSRFDAELYSLYKLTDCPVGGMIFSDSPKHALAYPETPSEIEHRFAERSKVYNSLIAKHSNLTALKIMLKLKAKQIDIANLPPDFASSEICISKNALEHLQSLDLKAINNAVIANNNYLISKLSTRLLLTDNSAYCSQATIGFPIRSANPDKLHKHLTTKGILGFTLKNGWKTEDTTDPYNHCDNHYCLPNTYKLSKRDLDKIASLVNEAEE